MSTPELVWPDTSQSQVLIDPLLKTAAGLRAPDVLSVQYSAPTTEIEYRWYENHQMIVAVVSIQATVTRHAHRRRWLLEGEATHTIALSSHSLPQTTRGRVYYIHEHGLAADVGRVNHLLEQVRARIS